MVGSYFRKILAIGLTLLAFLPTTVFAEAGQPVPGEIGLQAGVTPIMDSITAFHNGLLIWIISAIVLFVLGLMIYVMVRFNKRANPVPNRFSHNTLVEVVWVVVPILILLVIAAPSFAVLTDQMTIPDGERKYLGKDIFSWGEVDVPAPELTVKVTGFQWYWNYEYVDQQVDFDSYMLSDEDRASLKPNQPRLLAVDSELVVPVDTTVRVQVTGDPNGVIHSFTVPAFGVKTDAVPGRLNESWFHARKTGMYYGQCSELCGKDHAYMPIAVRVVAKEEFDTFMTAFQANGLDEANATLAAVD